MSEPTVTYEPTNTVIVEENINSVITHEIESTNIVAIIESVENVIAQEDGTVPNIVVVEENINTVVTQEVEPVNSVVTIENVAHVIIACPTDNQTPAEIVWNSATTYNVGDVVFFDGSFYESLTSNTNSTPDDNPLDWDQIVTSGGTGIVESIIAGDNINVDDTDAANPIVSSTQEYSQYIYNPDRIQAGSVYNDWEDLVTAINNKGNAPSTINFTKIGTQTLPAGVAPYNIRNVTWRGIGGAPGSGPQIFLEDGFALTPMPYWNLEFGVTVFSQSSQPIFTTDYGSNFRLNLITSGLGATNGCEAIRLNGGNGTLNILFLDNGASLGGASSLGYETIAATNSESMVIPLVLSGINSLYEEDSIRGGANSILLRFLNTLQQTGDPFPDQNNFTGTVLDQRGMPTLVGYDGTTSGLVASNIQAAIDELVTIIPSIPNGTMVNDVPTWNGTGYVPMPIQEKTTTLFDETTTPGVIYIGKALPTGSAISEAGAVWAIKTIDTTSDTEIKWADGVTTYTKVWNSRASYSYY